MAKPTDSLVKLLRKQYVTICDNRLFKRAEQRKKLLGYLLEAAINDKQEKGMEVAAFLYRSGDLDSVEPEDEANIRTAIHEIREKLALYYAGAGAKDPVIFEIVPNRARLTYRLRGDDDAESGWRRTMDEFFGDGASADGHNGVIIIRADFIETLLDGWVPPEQFGKLNGHHRLWKARRWMDACDMDAAQQIIESFSLRKIAPPRIVFSYPGHPDNLPGPASFEITLGGFTEKTEADLNSIGQGWMRWCLDGESVMAMGDGLSVHERIASGQRRLVTVDDQASGLKRLLPHGWAPEYVMHWLEKRKKPHATDVQDYAMILRNTEDLEHEEREQRRKVHLYLAGFTEVGTAAAGYYLAKKWPDLHSQYVEGQTNRPSRGDFLLLIEGPSDPHKLKTVLWKSVEAVTPDSLTKTFTPAELTEMKSSWVERLQEVR